MKKCINLYQENIKKMLKNYFGDDLDDKTMINALLDGELQENLGYNQDEAEAMYNYLNEKKEVKDGN